MALQLSPELRDVLSRFSQTLEPAGVPGILESSHAKRAS